MVPSLRKGRCYCVIAVGRLHQATGCIPFLSGNMPVSLCQPNVYCISMTKDWGFLGFHTALPKKSSLLGSLGGWGCVSSQQTCKIKAQQGDKFFTLILRSFPMLLDHLRRTKRRLRRKKPHGTPWGRAGSGDLSSLQLQQILGRNLQA